MKIWIANNTIEEIRKINQIDGGTFPEEEYPKNEKKLKGFIWRENERPKSVEDLFIDDKPYELQVIKGLEPYVPQEDFEDEDLRKRIEEAAPKQKKGTPKEENKAARRLTKKERELDKSLPRRTIKKE
jgi:hypothetical protein